jgi:hypothetical protein
LIGKKSWCFMPIEYRSAEVCDIASMAAIRAREWESEPLWKARIEVYLSGKHSPRQALAERISAVEIGHAEPKAY